MADTQGTQTLDTDDPVKGKGNIGPIRTQEITQEQKVARASNLGNAILQTLFKHASGDAAAPGEAGGAAQPAAAAAAPTPIAQPAAIPNDANGLAAGNDKTASELIVDEMSKEAAMAAQLYYEGYFSGMLKRAADEAEVHNSNLPAEYLAGVGGVSGLLDKVAMDFPEAVLPEGVDMAGGGEMPPEAAPEGMPPMPPPEGGGMEGLMGGEGGGMEGGEGGDPVEQLAAALEEAGVTPEELAQAVEDVSALQEAGIEPDQLAGAMTEMLGEGGEGGGMEGGGEMPPEAAPPEMPPEAPPAEPMQVEASGMSPITQRVRQILSQNR